MMTNINLRYEPFRQVDIVNVGVQHGAPQKIEGVVVDWNLFVTSL